MNGASIFWSTIRASSIFISGESPGTTSFGTTRSEGSFTIAASVGAAVVTSSRLAAARMRSNRAQPYLSAGAQPSPTIKSGTVSPGSFQRAEVDKPDASAEPVSDEDSVQLVPRNQRVQLTIDSLQNYELIRPIPVVIDSLADKIFTAEVTDLNLSISENSLGGALLFLKHRITTIYEEYRMKKTLDPEQSRCLEILQTYIGKTKRNWR
jgi:hypothetical protein